MRVGEARSHQSIAVELFALELDLVFLFLAREFQTTTANELEDLAQLVVIEPGAMTFAHIDDDTGTTRKVNAVHYTPALRTVLTADEHHAKARWARDCRQF